MTYVHGSTEDKEDQKEDEGRLTELNVILRHLKPQVYQPVSYETMSSTPSPLTSPLWLIHLVTLVSLTSAHLSLIKAQEVYRTVRTVGKITKSPNDES